MERKEHAKTRDRNPMPFMQDAEDLDCDDDVPAKRRFLPGGLDEMALADVNDFFTPAFGYGGVGEFC